MIEQESGPLALPVRRNRVEDKDKENYVSPVQYSVETRSSRRISFVVSRTDGKKKNGVGTNTSVLRQ